MDSGNRVRMRKATGFVLASILVGAAIVGANAATAAPAPAIVPAATAQLKVVKKVPGEVLSVRRAKRDGFVSWAVTVQRRDGSIVVGYVDTKSGIIFDWTVQQSPGEPVVDLDGSARTLTPAAPPAPPTSDPQDDPTADPDGGANPPSTPASPPVGNPSPGADDDASDDASDDDASDDDASDDDASDDSGEDGSDDADGDGEDAPSAGGGHEDRQRGGDGDHGGGDGHRGGGDGNRGGGQGGDGGRGDGGRGDGDGRGRR